MSLIDTPNIPTVDTILHSMAKGFHAVQAHDIRVESVHITPEMWASLMTDPKGYELTVHTLEPSTVKANLVKNHIGKWWGADLYLDTHFYMESQEYLMPQPNQLGLRRGTLIELCELVSPIIEKLKNNLNIIIKNRARPFRNMSSEECRAVETLREMISESDYRKYAKYGFILVTGKSGLIYQIHRDNPHTKVWKNGEKIEEICVHIKDTKIPPTDSVIAIKTMIEESEDAYRKCGNIYDFKKTPQLEALAA